MKIFLFTALVIFFAISLFAKPVNSIINPSLRKVNLSIEGISPENPIRICAIRVSFQPDDNPATTGNGQFLTSADTPCSEMVIDPPPHNIDYFKDHIESVANFYSHVSNGKVNIDFANSGVFPLIDSLTYLVSHTMDYYHPFLNKDSVDLRLAELFVEAVRLADPDVNFANYNLIVLFHAGVGQDFDLFLDPTPNDIPSAYMNQADLAAYLESENPGTTQLLVDDGTHPIRGGIILPETQNHLLFPNWKEVFGSYSTPCDYQIGLNGTFALMMGFYLGLPGLYNTETGETGVGKFGLMDQGSCNLNGLIPAFPSAWEREFMGWSEPAVAQTVNSVKLGYAESGADTTIWKVPINDNEYFLIENRCAYVRPGVSLDSIQYFLYEQNGKKEWPSILPLIHDSIGAVFSDNGVLLSVPQYDVGLPGSGLLIWHIDESIINPNLSANRVNLDRDHRGVDLEEGDGAQDLGYEADLLSGDRSIGWFFDPWFAGNEGFWDMNKTYPEDSIKSVGFTDDTNPSAKSNDFARSGIRIDKIGKAGDEMTFEIHRGNTHFDITGKWKQDGYHLSMPVVLDLDSTDSKQEFIFIGDSIYLWSSDGTQINSCPIQNGTWAGGLPAIPKYEDKNLLFAQLKSYDESKSLFVSCWKIASSGEIEFLFNRELAGSSDIISFSVWGDELVLSLFDSNSKEPKLVKLSSSSGSDSIEYVDITSVMQLVGDKDYTFGVAQNGEIYRILDSPFQVVQLYQIPDFPDDGDFNLCLGYLNNNDYPDLVVSCSSGIIEILDIITESRTYLHYSSEYYPGLMLSDIDADGKTEIIASKKDQIIALTDQLIVENNFPINFPNLYDSEKSFEPVIFSSDVDDDEIPDIIARIKGVGIVAFDHYGKMITGFPISVKDNEYDRRALLYTGTETIEVAIGDNHITGTLVSSHPLLTTAWSAYGGNSSHNFFYPVKPTATPISSTSLLNRKKTFNWPNPVKGNTTAVRYFLNQDANLSVNIYDLAGDLITSIKENNPVVGDPGEIVWNVSDINSGVYLAVVGAKSGSKSESVIIKILVVK